MGRDREGKKHWLNDNDECLNLILDTIEWNLPSNSELTKMNRNKWQKIGEAFMFSSQIQKHVLCLSIYIFFLLLAFVMCSSSWTEANNWTKQKKPFHMVCGYQKL